MTSAESGRTKAAVDIPRLFELRLGESSVEFFESLRLGAWAVQEGAAPTPKGQELVSALGFAGPQVRGSLTVRSTQEFFIDTHPAARQKGSVAQDAIVDWASEFTNQLLGRFKNKMLAYGLDFQVTVPVTIFGENIVEATANRDVRITQGMRTASHIVWATLSAQLAPGVELYQAPVGKVALRPGKSFVL